MNENARTGVDLGGMIRESRAGRFFWKTTSHPRIAIVVSILAILLAASFVPSIVVDASTEAFVDPKNPAAVYRDKVEEIFGLSDPVIVAVVRDGEEGIFSPDTLRLVQWLTEEVAETPGIDPERVTSIATENNIFGTADGMVVEPFFREPPSTKAEAEAIRDAVLSSPLHTGSLVARDGTATLIVAELLDETRGSSVYRHLLEVAERAPVGDEEVHIAGEGAVRDHLGTYIDSDARRLNPVGFALISVILFLAYRTARGVLLPNLVVLGGLSFAFGTMAALEVPFFIITNALPVILIAIGVADCVHILGEYYEAQARWPDATSRELAVHATSVMWRPITITSLTDIAGFLALSAASTMLPLQAFGVFASVGAAAALVLSLLAVPAVLTLLRPRPSKAFSGGGHERAGPEGDRFGRALGALGKAVAAHASAILVVAVSAAILALVGATKIEVDDERIANFRRTEPIYQADRIINERLDGTQHLDVVIETPEPDGLLEPDRLRRIEALQRYLESLESVKGSTSIVDYLKQINRAVNENDPEAYRIPESSDLAAQYLLLYSAMADPTDLEEEVDYEYRLANVRATLDTGRYSEVKSVMERAERYLREEFGSTDMTATLSGRTAVNYHWIRGIGASHFRGVALALAAVWLMASVSFRSSRLGLLAMLPVSMAVLFIYAVMGFGGITLGVATSMFAAIAIGTGVDFAVHVLDRLVVAVRDEGQPVDAAFQNLFPSTGRAVFFNATAVIFGFGVLTLSYVPSLVWFGTLVTVAAFVSFLASLTLVPAIVRRFPRVIATHPQGAHR